MAASGLLFSNIMLWTKANSIQRSVLVNDDNKFFTQLASGRLTFRILYLDGQFRVHACLKTSKQANSDKHETGSVVKEKQQYLHQ